MIVPEIYRKTARNDVFIAVEERLKPDRKKKFIPFSKNYYPVFQGTIRRKLTSTEISLASLYTRNEALQTLVRYTWALSMVSIDQAIPLWDKFITL